jgi:hypothetical protein
VSSFNSGYGIAFENSSSGVALLDRLRRRCITISIDGPSLRSPEAQG